MSKADSPRWQFFFQDAGGDLWREPESSCEALATSSYLYKDPSRHQSRSCFCNLTLRPVFLSSFLRPQTTMQCTSSSMLQQPIVLSDRLRLRDSIPSKYPDRS